MELCQLCCPLCIMIMSVVSASLLLQYFNKKMCESLSLSQFFFSAQVYRTGLNNDTMACKQLYKTFRDVSYMVVENMYKHLTKWKKFFRWSWQINVMKKGNISLHLKGVFDFQYITWTNLLNCNNYTFERKMLNPIFLHQQLFMFLITDFVIRNVFCISWTKDSIWFGSNGLFTIQITTQKHLMAHLKYSEIKSP